MNQIPDLQISSVIDDISARVVRTEEPRRLVMVLFEVEEEAFLARRILEVARPREMCVLLIGVSPDRMGDPELRRKLARIAAFLRDHSTWNIQAGLRIENRRDWLEGIRLTLCPDDILACYSEQMVGVLERPLVDILSSSLKLPVYTFSGLQAPELQQGSRRSQAAAWIGSIASIGAFLLVQARIVTVTQGITQSALLLLSLFAEVGLIWLLNSLMG